MFTTVNSIGRKVQQGVQGVTQAVMADVQALSERRAASGSTFDEAAEYKRMLIGFQVDQAKLGKEIQAAMREKEDEATHWKSLYEKSTGKEDDAEGRENAADGGDAGGGAMGVDEVMKLRSQVDVLNNVYGEWEAKLRGSIEKSTEERAHRLKMEHQMKEVTARCRELEAANKERDDHIAALSADKARMMSNSGSDTETIDDLVDEYSRLAAEHAAQRDADASAIRRLENVRDELVEKLKAHERNILQLLEQGHGGAVPQDGEESLASSSTVSLEEMQAKLKDQEESLKKEAEDAIVVIREEMAKASKEEQEKALTKAMEEHNTALKLAVEEAVKNTEDKGAKDLENAVSSARAEVEASSEKDRSALLAEKTLELAAIAKERDAVKEEVKATEARSAKILEESLKEQQEKLDKESQQKLDQLRKEMESGVTQAHKSRDEAKELYAKENKARKAIHNKLMELQGNIRVLARVRPMVEVEVESGKSTDVTEFPTDEDLVIKRDEQTDNKFEFDRVFRPDSTQGGVYTAVSPIITSVLDGYNVCIFAYGQTGSGKTHTMEGPSDDPGVNTRALKELFDLAKERSEDITYRFRISMMEIYNETVRDLLDPTLSSKGTKSPNAATSKGLEIRQTVSGGTNVPGLTETEVKGMSEVMATLEQGAKNRAVGAHDMNEHSSRSHMIFSVRAMGTNRHTGEVTRAKLHLIDLAGSERISKTDATGERLREAQNINRSLSALGDVIAALAQAKSHVPFRNSKLTFVLQDALSGNSKVMMFVNVSPASYNVMETLCSLNFAARCRSVKLGGAHKNQDGADTARLRRIIEALQNQLAQNNLTPVASLNGLSSSGSTSSRSQASSASPAKPPTSTGSARRKSLGGSSTGSKGV